MVPHHSILHRIHIESTIFTHTLAKTLHQIVNRLSESIMNKQRIEIRKLVIKIFSMFSVEVFSMFDRENPTPQCSNIPSIVTLPYICMSPSKEGCRKRAESAITKAILAENMLALGHRAGWLAGWQLSLFQ